MAHIPVLLKEVVRFFGQNSLVDRAPLYADLTFGDGGHSFAILKADANAEIVAFDQDPEAVADGRKKIREHCFEKRIQLVQGNFACFPQYLNESANLTD